ncbi:MAG: glycosyltransferase family 39 protein [Burkholderiaceae bacterium]|nr:glycosyltransferase family 39 protein [Burkholderiaceae bacterium]
MLRRFNLWWVLAALLCLPLLSMWLLPLIDTSEPRYAEIARLMAQSGDWITPWFEPGLPFWGKPPLSFWAQALSFKLFGVSEFSARLPSWLAMLGTVSLLIAYTRSVFSLRTALWAAIIYSSCALAYLTSGAVLTDPFLALATTWAMVAFVMASRQPTFIWRYGFFIGVSLGLLAKGPLALVLIAGPLALCLLAYPSVRHNLRALPWVTGTLLTLAISLPWYILAEIKTPGFLNYFIIGEHFLRFVDPGWKGDLYGSAHQRMYGTIWWYWLQATFPWGILATVMLAMAAAHKTGRRLARLAILQPDLGYLLAWSLFTPLFFTVAGNILWTYLLPCLGAFSILMAVTLRAWQTQSPRTVQRMRFLAAIAPVALFVMTLATVLQPDRVKTERELVHYAEQQSNLDSHLLYLDKRPFSARFYSHGTAGLLSLAQLPEALSGQEPFYLAVPKPLLPEAEKVLTSPLHIQFENQRYVLLKVQPSTHIASAQNPVQ